MSILEVFGQDRAVRHLQKARRARRVPHSYVFHGPNGVGKGLLARQWAKLLLCAQPVRKAWPRGQNAGEIAAGEAPGGEIDDCCDSCPDCHLVAAGTHPDLHIINKELIRFAGEGRDRQPLSLPIDVIREFVIGPVGLYPSRGQARVFIIEEAERMTRAAQNALLKTLEEPPPSTFLLLITTQFDMLLPTVRSRCQPIRFSPLPGAFVQERLRQAGLAGAAALYWADLCDGGLGTALEWAALELYEKKCEIIERLGRLNHATALELAALLVEDAKEFAEKFLKRHPDHAQSSAVRQGQVCFLKMINHAFAAALRQLLLGEAAMPQVGLDQPEAIVRIGRFYGVIGCSEAIRATCRAENLLEANVNVALTFEALMLEYLGCAGRGALQTTNAE